MDLERPWTDDEMRAFITEFSAFMHEGYETRRKPNRQNKANQDRLEPVSVVSATVRAIIIVRVILFTLVINY